MSKRLDFFLFIGSTYTYLAVQRAESVAAHHGIELNWRPFSARHLMVDQNNLPFLGKPLKLAYMWRDLERRAARHRIPFSSIPVYPIDKDELANRVATLAAMEGWCPAYVKAAYSSWFLENKDPGQLEHLQSTLESLGKDPKEVMARANSEVVRDKYSEETEVARSLGMFGSPTFVLGPELFWGDDRLEDAVDWASSH